MAAFLMRPGLSSAAAIKSAKSSGKLRAARVRVLGAEARDQEAAGGLQAGRAERGRDLAGGAPELFLLESARQDRDGLLGGDLGDFLGGERAAHGVGIGLELPDPHAIGF